MNRFTEVIQRFNRRMREQADRRVRRIVLKLLAEVLERTPVDQGTLRANWNCSEGSPDRSFDPKKRDYDASLTAAAGAIGHRLIGKRLFITNSTPYALRIEFGYSRQAPNGMMWISVERIKRLIRARKL